MDFRFEIYFAFIIFVLNFKPIKTNSNKIRQRRTLVFPETAPTRVQFIGGIGIPVEDLLYEAVTSGYVLKAEYFLPTKAEELTHNYLKPQQIARRSASTITNPEMLTTNWTHQQNLIAESFHSGSNWRSQQTFASVYRWVVYKAIELALSSSGLPGRTCLLRCICEHSAAPMHYGGGILAELLHIILTPSTSNDKFENNANRVYFEAEKMGRSGSDCKLEFSSCRRSPLDLITTVIDFNDTNY